ncbi:MAG: patatin-like phospholipase family protein [Alphaproteobacteria bacterium]|nr:patatin-like phospholipase family protein [Alphaproteobacteria bacterium]MCB9795308.1 patatin-like phospholipase family protein [Alphaproteobacteria bacterium]
MSSFGLILAGGAARGAYAAGVMRFLFTAMPQMLGRVRWPEVVSGTSVGALNGVFAAARDLERVRWLSRTWQQMRIEQIYALHPGSVFTMLRSTFTPIQGASLLDSSPLRRLVVDNFPTEALRRAIDGGDNRAFVVSATQISTGYNMLFVDASEKPAPLRPLPGARFEQGPMRPEHLLASAGLPFLFPPVDVDGKTYVDGGLRQNTPLRPALQLGVDRALVVGVLMSKEAEGIRPMPSITPTLPFLAGKTLNALMLDPVERDITHAEGLNRILEWGAARYGADFLRDIQVDLGLRPVQLLHVQPTEDLGRIAAATFRSEPPPVSAALSRLLGLVADNANAGEGESDLLSYLYFDRAFTAQIEALGFEDAARREEELMAFVAGVEDR